MPDEITSQELVLRYTFNVTTADCDMNARLRTGGLVNFLVLAAINSADTLGFGYEGLRGQQLFWVLSRMTVEIYKPLKWFDKVTVETWPKDISGLLYLRDFIVTDQHGEVVAKCVSGWLAIDLATKQPKNIQDRFANIINKMKDRHALERLPEKLLPVKNGNTIDLKTTWFDLDLNKHVTSTRYVDWMIDMLPTDFLGDNYPKGISLNYLKETMLGEQVRMTYSEGKDGALLFEGVNITRDIPCIRGKLIF